MIDEKLANQGPEVAAATLLQRPFSRADLLRLVAESLEGAAPEVFPAGAHR